MATFAQSSCQTLRSAGQPSAFGSVTSNLKACMFYSPEACHGSPLYPGFWRRTLSCFTSPPFKDVCSQKKGPNPSTLDARDTCRGTHPQTLKIRPLLLNVDSHSAKNADSPYSRPWKGALPLS
eukprot:m.87488 g.87488  ORF g.87488 m.87488 type:complete len:123 (-) comp8790_c0_seq2:152-520(-)